jgi:hypothetical protein
MNLNLASTAELYAEHRRTLSLSKKKKIAAELQRRHDELNCLPGHGLTWWIIDRRIGSEVIHSRIQRFDFVLML